MCANCPEKYENFPWRIVLFRQALAAAFLACAIFVMSRFGLSITLSYVAYVVLLFLSIAVFVCRYCYYHSRRCDLGFSIITTILTQKGSDKRKFVKNGIRSILFLLIMIGVPIIFGAIAFAQDISLRNGLMLLAVIVTGIVFVYSTPQISCPHCKMSVYCPLALKENYAYIQ